MVAFAFSYSEPTKVFTFIETPHYSEPTKVFTFIKTPHLYIVKDNTVIDSYNSTELDSIAVVKTHSSHNLRFFGKGIELASYDVNLDIDSIIFENSLAGEFKDSLSGEIYSWVQVGKTKWMTENLNYLPNVYPTSDTSSVDERYYVYDYDGNSTKEAKKKNNYRDYGVLYNWQGALDACPNGWRLPTKDEWEELVDIAQGVANASNRLRASYSWDDSSEVNNSIGFSALAGGYLNSNFDFAQITSQAYWWSSTRTDDSVYYFNLSKDLALVSATKNEYVGYSVRCVEGDVAKHKLSISVQGEGSYSISSISENDDNSFTPNKRISISAQPKDSLVRFSHWSGDVQLLADSTKKTTSFYMPESAVNLVANFAPNLKITIEANPLGAATFTGGDGIYGPGDTVSIRTTVDTNYRFLGWADNSAIMDANSANTRVIMPDGNLKITANFAQTYQLNLKADLAAGGTLVGGGRYAANAAVTIDVSVKANYQFAYWTGPGAMYLEDSTQTSTKFSGGMPANEVNITAKIVATKGELTDSRDGNKYSWKLYGNMQWFTKNLAYLPEIYGASEMSVAEKRYYVYQVAAADTNTAKRFPNYEDYGVLYNYQAAMDVKGVCPAGWYVPKE